MAGLNAATAPGTYAFIDTGVVGTDEIRVALIYQPGGGDAVQPVRDSDSSVDPEFIDTMNRPALAQTFTQNSNGKQAHRGREPLEVEGIGLQRRIGPRHGRRPGPLQRDTRRGRPQALVRWLAADPTGAGDPDVLLIGDMNSYAKEDPIAAILEAATTTSLPGASGPAPTPTCSTAQSGYLDHALASTALTPRVTGVREWHINADEPVRSTTTSSSRRPTR